MSPKLQQSRCACITCILKKVDEIDIEEYVKGVVMGEMPLEFDLEALKAQAICSRTYAYYFKMGYATSTFAKSA